MERQQEPHQIVHFKDISSRCLFAGHAMKSTWDMDKVTCDDCIERIVEALDAAKNYNEKSYFSF